MLRIGRKIASCLCICPPVEKKRSARLDSISRKSPAALLKGVDAHARFLLDRCPALSYQEVEPLESLLGIKAAAKEQSARDKAQQNVAELEARRDELTAELQSLRSECMWQRQQMLGIDKAREEDKAALEAAQAAEASMRAERDMALAEAKVLRQELEAKDAGLVEAARQLQESQEQLNSTRTSVDSLRESAGRQGKELKELSRKLEDAQQDVQDWQAEREAASRAARVCQAALAAQEDEVKTLRLWQKGAKIALGQLHAQLLVAEWSTAAAVAAAAAARSGRHRQKLHPQSEAAHDRQQLAAALGLIKAEKKQLETQAHTQLLRIRRKLSAFAADRLALRKLVEAKEEEIQELQENCAHLQTELDAATVRLEAFEESDLPVLPFDSLAGSLSEKLGSGGEGTVISMQLNVAVKVPSTPSLCEFEADRQMARALPRHENVLHPFCEVQLPKNMLAPRGLVMPAARCNMLDLIEMDEYNSTQAVRLMKDVVAGVGHMHDNGFVHMDIKPQNILIMGRDIWDARAMLADFGLSRQVDNDDLPEAWSGTYGFSSPVSFLHPEASGEVDDLRAVCATALQLFTGLSLPAVLCVQFAERVACDPDAVAAVRARLQALRPDLAQPEGTMCSEGEDGDGKGDDEEDNGSEKAEAQERKFREDSEYMMATAEIMGLIGADQIWPCDCLNRCRRLPQELLDAVVDGCSHDTTLSLQDLAEALKAAARPARIIRAASIPPRAGVAA